LTAKQYVDAVMKHVYLPFSIRRRIKADLQSDIALLIEEGQTIEEIIERMGPAEKLAAELTENYYYQDHKPFHEYKSKTSFLGLPLLHVVTAYTQVPSVRFFGARAINIGGRTLPLYGLNSIPTAKGVVAIGIKAKGIISCGMFSMGILSIGLFTMGLFSIGLISLGLLSLGLISVGLVAIGNIAIGLASLGLVALGQFAIGQEAFGKIVLAIPKGTSFATASAMVNSFLKSSDISPWVFTFYQNAFSILNWCGTRIPWVIGTVVILLLVVVGLSQLLAKNAGWQ